MRTVRVQKLFSITINFSTKLLSPNQVPPYYKTQKVYVISYVVTARSQHMRFPQKTVRSWVLIRLFMENKCHCSFSDYEGGNRYTSLTDLSFHCSGALQSSGKQVAYHSAYGDPKETPRLCSVPGHDLCCGRERRHYRA